MYRYKKKKGKKKERRRNFSQFSCPQCSYLSETVLKCTTHFTALFLLTNILLPIITLCDIILVEFCKDGNEKWSLKVR